MTQDGPVTTADAHVAFVAETRKQLRGKKGGRGKRAGGGGGGREKRLQPLLNFNGLLNALLLLALKMFETQSCADGKDAAFEAILMENVLPFAQRRAPEQVFPLSISRSLSRYL